MIFNQTIHPTNNKSNFLAKTYFQKTNYIFRKPKQKTQLQVVNLMPEQYYATLDIQNSTKQLSLGLQRTGSNFMKQYIDKLKRQRKRSHKKIVQNNPRTQSLHSSHHSPQIFILQKIPKVKQNQNKFDSQKISFILQELKKSKGNKHKLNYFQQIQKAYHTEKKSNIKAPKILNPITLNLKKQKSLIKNSHKLYHGQVQPWKSQRQSQDFSILAFCK